MKLRVNVQKATDENKQKFPSRLQFADWVACALVAGVASYVATEVTIRLISETESAELNRSYRHKSGPTNILSFPFDEFSENEAFYLGDLAICAALVEKEAQEQQKTVLAHWAHLTVHGVLHLLGYDHELAHEAEIMEALEIEILQKLGIDNPYG